MRAMVHYKALTLLAVIFLGSGGGGLLVSAAAVPLVPAVYVFGDSTMDVGNNHYLPGWGPPQLPYGIDFPGSVSTGRASNGYVMSDSIARVLGFNMSPPAYLSLTPETSGQIFQGYGGVNYASGGSGILDDTDPTETNPIPLSQQVAYFAATKSNMTQHNPGEINELLSSSLFLISAGGNDMFAFIKKNPKPTKPQVAAFCEYLVSSYGLRVRRLHALGARRFGVIDVPALGCLPLVRNSSETGESECVQGANDLAEHFNNRLRARMAYLAKSVLPGMSYSVGSSFNLVLSFTANHPENGFVKVASACCGGGRLGVGIGCLDPNATYCENRDDHIFWDGVHSTQATYERGARAIFYDPVEKGFAAPINFEELVSSPFAAIARS